MIIDSRSQRIRNWAMKNTKHTKWFAWFPVTLEDGRTAWMEKVSRQRTVMRRGYSLFKGYYYWSIR